MNFPFTTYQALITWERQLLGVRWPGSALVQLTDLAVMVECFSIKPRPASTGQSAARPAHPKELTLPRDQSLISSKWKIVLLT